jgi:23S rRNA pseudouridine1911/1915/1917 synthase
MLLKAVIKGQDLKSFLALSLSISKSKAKELIDAKLVFVNNKRIWIATHQLCPGDEVSVDMPDTARKTDKIDILYEDDNVIAINKPSGLVSDRAGDSCESLLKKQLNNPKICAIHRLDKETTGVMLLAKSYQVFEAFKAMWQEKEVDKVYYAISTGEAAFKRETVNEPVDGRDAISHVELLAKGYGLSLFRVKMETGRKHQIRIHLKFLGHPVLGDKEYGPNIIEGEWRKKIKRQMLHAREISYTDPVTGKKTRVIASFPQDFTEVAAKAGFKLL